MAETDVGLVGVGLLGTALAERLLLAGFSVVGWDTDAQARQRLSDAGGTVASSLDEAVRCRRVVFSLPDDRVVVEVIDEAEPALVAGATVIDTTTGDPRRQADVGKRLADRGVAYLDATVAGSSQHVREGRAVMMVGGEAEALERCRDLFDCWSPLAIHVGDCGSGARMKLVTNLVLGLNRAVLAEGLALAAGFGFDPDLTLECLQSGPAWSRAMDDKGQKMITGDFAPQARLSQHLKDVRLMLAAGGRCDTHLPLTRVHCEMLAWVERSGFGDEDNSAIRRAYR